jgi:uncharacterized damage-inducible protein DinB
MDFSELLVDAFGRVRETVHSAVADSSPEILTYRPDPEANTIAWLVWHLTRVQDDHIAGVAGTDQVWTAKGWSARFGLPFPESAHGYGQRPADVAAVTSSAELLLGYYDATHESTLAFVRSLGAGELDRVVDEDWDPPVTMAVRLISVINDDLQHAGQAAYLKGLAERAK